MTGELPNNGKFETSVAENKEYMAEDYLSIDNTQRHFRSSEWAEAIPSPVFFIPPVVKELIIAYNQS